MKKAKKTKKSKSKKAKHKEENLDHAKEQKSEVPKQTEHHSHKTEKDYAPIVVVLICIGLIAAFFLIVEYYPSETERGKDITQATLPETKPETDTIGKVPKTRVPIPDYAGKEISFDEGFALFKEIDNSYGVNYHEESLGKTMVKPGIIDRVITDFTKARESIAQAQNNSQQRSLVSLFDARLAQLNSQKFFQKALTYGMKGVFTGQQSCKYKDELLIATDFYNQSYVHGLEANKNMDWVYIQHKPAIEIIGVDKEKPEFYRSPLGDLYKLIYVNDAQVEKYCE